MIRALVVDDEPLARSNLLLLLHRDADITAVSECASGAEAIQEIRRSRPQLVFLDVQMPECNGFEVLETLKAEDPPVIVFVTAFDEHALRAFEAGALDYLLKPFDDARFAVALRRAKQRISERRSAAHGIARASGAVQPTQLAIKSAGAVSYVQIADIQWIEAADYYVTLHVGGKPLLLRRSLAELENDLDANAFCRIHRSAMVNLARVRSVELDAGEYQVILDDGKRLRLSRKYRRELRARMAQRVKTWP